MKFKHIYYIASYLAGYNRYWNDSETGELRADAIAPLANGDDGIVYYDADFWDADSPEAVKERVKEGYSGKRRNGFYDLAQMFKYNGINGEDTKFSIRLRKLINKYKEIGPKKHNPQEVMDWITTSMYNHNDVSLIAAQTNTVALGRALIELGRAKALAVDVKWGYINDEGILDRSKPIPNIETAVRPQYVVLRSMGIPEDKYDEFHRKAFEEFEKLKKRIAATMIYMKIDEDSGGYLMEDSVKEGTKILNILDNLFAPFKDKPSWEMTKEEYYSNLDRQFDIIRENFDLLLRHLNAVAIVQYLVNDSDENFALKTKYYYGYIPQGIYAMMGMLGGFERWSQLYPTDFYVNHEHDIRILNKHQKHIILPARIKNRKFSYLERWLVTSFHNIKSTYYDAWNMVVEETNKIPTARIFNASAPNTGEVMFGLYTPDPGFNLGAESRANPEYVDKIESLKVIPDEYIEYPYAGIVSGKGMLEESYIICYNLDEELPDEPVWTKNTSRKLIDIYNQTEVEIIYYLNQYIYERNYDEDKIRSMFDNIVSKLKEKGGK